MYKRPVFRSISDMTSDQIKAEIRRLDGTEWTQRVNYLREVLRLRQTATARGVAQAISFAVDEVQEFGDSDGRMGLTLNRETDEAPETALRVTEVSAELQTSMNGRLSTFQVTTSDGKVWDVKVTPARN